jgi:gas vesicle protein
MPDKEFSELQAIKNEMKAMQELIYKLEYENAQLRNHIKRQESLEEISNKLRKSHFNNLQTLKGASSEKFDEYIQRVKSLPPDLRQELIGQ